mgnify:CR=1 FL=1
MSTFSVEQSEGLVSTPDTVSTRKLRREGLPLRCLLFEAVVSWACVCRVFAAHTDVGKLFEGELPREDAVYPSRSGAWTGGRDFSVLDEDLVKTFAEAEGEGFDEVWDELTEENCVSVCFESGSGATLKASKVVLDKPVLDASKGCHVEEAWKLSVSQPMIGNLPADDSGSIRESFSRYLSTWMYWTSKSNYSWCQGRRDSS